MNSEPPLQEQLKSESQIALEGSEPFQILPDGRILTVKHNYPNNSVDLWEVNSKGEWTSCWIDYGNGHYAVILADLASTIGKRISLIGVFALSVWLLTGTLANGQAATPSKTPAAPKAGAGTNASTPFRDNGDGTVTDTKTGAMWQKDDDGQERKWADSVKYCAALTLAHHSDWKLPGMENLVPLWENAGSKPEIRNTYFPSMKDKFYWSSSKSMTFPGGLVSSYWGINFYGEGVQGWGTDGGNTGLVRCVRLGIKLKGAK